MIYSHFFKEPKRFLHLLQHCRQQELILTEDDIEPFDSESTVAIRVRCNDVSFITKDNQLIILVKHQSTINPNIVLRLFLYYGELLSLWIKTSGVNLIFQ